MPNHVTSRCTITGPADEVARFKATAIVTKMEERGEHWPAEREPKEYTEFDFNAVIPMPDVLVGSLSGSHADLGSQLLLISNANQFSVLGSGGALYDHERERVQLASPGDDFPNCARAFLSANPDIRGAGLAAMRAIVETGYSNWYPWAIDNWGTKWGAYSFEELSADPLRSNSRRHGASRCRFSRSSPRCSRP